VTEGWTVDPWAGKVDDAFIYGHRRFQHEGWRCRLLLRGQEALIDAGVKLSGDVILTFVLASCKAASAPTRWSSKDFRRRPYFNNFRADRS